MQSGYIDSNGVKIYYEIEGQGKPLILLNGGPGFPHEYLQEMRALAPHAKLVFFDQRGTGKSDKTDPRNYTIDANVEDVENLRKALNLGKCRVLGHSWGGMLAQAYILKFPENVTQLILADTFSSLEDCNAALARMRAGVPPETRAIYEKYEREGLYKNRDHYPDEYKAALEVAYAPVFMSVPPPPYLQNAFAKVSYDVYRAMWGEETEFKMTGTLKEFNVESRLKEIRVPTLVIVGANDMPTIAMAEKTARLIPKARLEVFAQSRHFPFIEEKEKFMNIVREFLEA
ncbi:proline iminopeptidase-family hydrolase [Candidatus Acetothermia bacterium]|nr:proline iminopeptidase-family hydrolase [Candidatus Acetothermia bacterium]